MIQLHEGWDDDDDEDDDSDLDECPNCGRSIYDDSERCPECGTYLSREVPSARHPWWVTVGAVVSLLMVVYWILHP